MYATALGSAAQTKQVKPGMTRYQGSSRATVTAVPVHRRGSTAFGAKCCESCASLSLDHQHPPPSFRAYFLHSCLLASVRTTKLFWEEVLLLENGLRRHRHPVTLQTIYYFVFRNEATGLLLLRHPCDECGYLRSSL